VKVTGVVIFMKLPIVLVILLVLVACTQAAPSLSYWFEPAPAGIHVRRSTVVAVFLDPSFYYRLEASSAHFYSLISTQQLTEFAINSYACQALFSRPTPWTLWWQPKSLDASSCYQGDVRGNIVYLLFSPGQSTAYLDIQNT
jgi:hypothetical protein